MPEYRLRIIIEGKDQASGAVDKARNSVSGLDKALGAIKWAAIAAGAYKVAEAFANYAVEATFARARVDEMNAVLNVMARNNDMTAETMQKTVKAIKDQGIETSVAQQVTAQFTRYQMDLAKASDLARVAQDAAVLSMENSSEALDGLIYGITTYNPRVLRTHGLNVNMAKAFDDMAASLGKTSEELTTAEKTTAALNAALQEGTRIQGAYEAAMKEPGKLWRSLPRYANEAAIVVGGPFQGALGSAATGLKDMYSAVIDNSEAIQHMLQPLGDAAQKVIDFGTNAATAAIDIMALNESVNWLQQNIDDLAHGEQMIAQAQEDAADAAREESERRREQSQRYIDAIHTTQQLIEQYPHLEAALRRTAKASQDVAQAKGQLLFVDEYGYEHVQPNAIAGNEYYAQSVEQLSADLLELQDKIEGATHAKRVDAGASMAAAAATRALAASLRTVQVAGTYNANIMSFLAKKQAEYTRAVTSGMGGGGGGGPSVAELIAERERDAERERVKSAEWAGYEISKFRRDQMQWITDNEANLTEELQREFAARTEAAYKEAEKVKDDNAELAEYIVDAEKRYQEEKARIMQITDEEERADKLARLEREYTEERGDFEEQQRIRAKQRQQELDWEIEAMRQAGSAGGAAMAEEFGSKFETILDAWDALNQSSQKGVGESLAAWRPYWDEQDRRAKVLKGFIDDAAAAAARIDLPANRRQAGARYGGNYDIGGVVPGPVGIPQLAVVHGGEEILTPSQRAERNGPTYHITIPIAATVHSEGDARMLAREIATEIKRRTA